MIPSRSECELLDAQDRLGGHRAEFCLPESLIYLDGNSLGALPAVVPDAIAAVVAEEWGQDLIASWNSHAWIDLPREVGEKIAPLLGAAPGQVIAADSTSVNLFKLLAAGLDLTPGRRRILCVTDSFPTDLYVADGLSALLGAKRCEVQRVAADEVAAHIDGTTAVVLLSHVDFRTGRLADLSGLTRCAHEAGAVVLWDLAHSAGAMPLCLDADGVDFAVGCGYKYLNGGPGAPAFAYVAQRHQARVRQPLSGWMGHASPFDFTSDYQPAPGINRFLCGTPSVIAMKALSAALDIWRSVDLVDVRAKSTALSELFISLVESSSHLGSLKLASPRQADLRGSQISFAHRDGYAIMRALIEAGVIGDFREPDLLRFGFAPLYLRYVDIWDAVSSLEEIVRERRFDQPGYRQRLTVT